MATSKINRSEVMKRAWSLFKEWNGKRISKYFEGVGYVWSKYEISFSECLKESWEYMKKQVAEYNKMVNRLNSFKAINNIL